MSERQSPQTMYRAPEVPGQLDGGDQLAASCGLAYAWPVRQLPGERPDEPFPWAIFAPS